MNDFGEFLIEVFFSTQGSKPVEDWPVMRMRTVCRALGDLWNAFVAAVLQAMGSIANRWMLEMLKMVKKKILGWAEKTSL